MLHGTFMPTDRARSGPLAEMHHACGEPKLAVVGITSRLEGEEMPVTQPGFLGGDRTSIDLPQAEEALVEAVASAGKPMVVVLINGSALGVNWIDKLANAVLEAWYPGEEGGANLSFL